MKYWNEAGAFDFIDVPREKKASLARKFYDAWEKVWRTPSTSQRREMNGKIAAGSGAPFATPAPMASRRR